MTPTESADILAFVVLMLLTAFRVALIGVVVWLLIPRRRACPQCREPTVPMVTPRGLVHLLLERRWCMACGWQGLARQSRVIGNDAPAPPPLPVPVVLLVLTSLTG